MKVPKLNSNKKGGKQNLKHQQSTKMQNNKPQSHDRKKRGKKPAKKQSGTPIQKTKTQQLKVWLKAPNVGLRSALTSLPARLFLSYSALSQLSSADSFGLRANRQCQPRCSKKWLTISSIDVAVSALISHLSVRTHIDLHRRGLWGCLHKNTTGSVENRAQLMRTSSPQPNPTPRGASLCCTLCGSPASAIRPCPHPSAMMRAVDRWVLTKRRWRHSPPTAVCQQHLGSWKKNKKQKNKCMMRIFFVFGCD